MSIEAVLKNQNCISKNGRLKSLQITFALYKVLGI